MLDIKKIKLLRDETGVSFSLCTKALDQSKGDIDTAKKLLSEWGVEQSEQKAKRETKQGTIFSYIHHNRKIGVLIELLCETDFVAKNTDFQKLGHDIAMHIASANPKSNEALLSSAFIKDETRSIEKVIKEYILKIGENIKVGHFVRYEI